MLHLSELLRYLNSMKITHDLNALNQKITSGQNSASFILSNKKESFCWINDFPDSRFQGVFFAIGGKIFRVIESINPARDTSELTNKFSLVERKKEKNKEIFFMPDNLNAFSYETEEESDIYLDFKEIYSNDYSNYVVEKTKDGLLVSLDYQGEKFYLSIIFDGDFSLGDKWFYRMYDYDKGRNSSPSDRNVFYLGKIKSKKIIFFVSRNKEEALEKSKEFFKNTEKYKKEKEKRVEKIFKKIKDKKVSLAYNSCRVLLDNLATDKGLFAGLPWFFQYWSRDELISLKGLYGFDKKSSKEIILKWIRSLKSGWINFPAKYKTNGEPEGLSIDACGWLLKRLELFPELKKGLKNELISFFETLDEEFIRIKNNTWMDSITRETPVEIQAMKLYALKMAFELTGKKSFSEKERELKEKVLEKFYNKEGWLYDSVDGKIRPNIFIAYYFYPELLERKQWEKVFDNELKELWLEWGGLATISKKDFLYHPDYSGETPGSYHNGDSWFWINNLAALVLYDLNNKKYVKYIKKILEASTEEILFMNAIGNHCELSSASSLKSEGCPSQAFSAAMYVEMVDKFYKS
jgi:hypothetical protein